MKKNKKKSEQVVAVIPARYGSTRFPAKALALLQGKPLIEWVWRKVKQSKKISLVIVATDDRRIAEAIEKLGGETRMTSERHPSGTDRVAEAIQGIRADWIVNVQGDEPMIEGRVLDDFISQFGSEGMVTMARKMDQGEETDPNKVKVVTDACGKALYFSRSVIPFRRDLDVNVVYWHHLGIYAYRPATLRRLVKLPPSPLEQTEKLEQLRALENGIAIRVIPTALKTLGVDTPEDLAKVERLLK